MNEMFNLITKPCLTFMYLRSSDLRNYMLWLWTNENRMEIEAWITYKKFAFLCEILPIPCPAGLWILIIEIANICGIKP